MRHRGPENGEDGAKAVAFAKRCRLSLLFSGPLCRQAAALACGVALALALLAGCDRARRGPGYFTRQNFETVYPGQPDWAVEEKLGHPQERHADHWVYVNERPYYRAVVRFAGGKVTETQWSYDRPGEAAP